ncbi:MULTISPECIES: hypothetical protein [Bacillus]|uniref:SPBc2 prophage-derived uncharacterized protein YorF n=1 Tax=Bacillus sonorensis TaxID=119858 RepID=A0ABM6LIV6_9BACI|nr:MULTISPECIES: hypothetical protein [Bacillus]ASB89284.1 SPBc2 prophage-derived uncharacterized protein YorF [Bacillus sonorensis]MEC0496699.1 hypothetical protein [Bacillus glycinifermentans]MEC0543533.1 hypothetical protein [Bacillus glycinifermentans]RHJ10054.1 hypothetical protein DW143_12420 [Bacillus sonorensis]UBF34814.1 hypothetical protein K9N56_10935 [Bacillus sp. PM8313]
MAENQTVLREAENKVVLEGLLLEVRHNEWKNGEGLNIELDIETAPNEVHTVTGMSKYKKEDGSDNGIAKGYKTIINDYKSVATHGKEEADRVRVTQGRIGLNEYFVQDNLKSYPQLSTNFVNRLKSDEEYNPRAEFEVEFFVKGVKEEKIKGEETGRVLLEGYIPLYGGKIIPFTFAVTKEGSDYVENNYEKGSSVKVFGNIINFKEKKVTLQQAAFGKDKQNITYNTKREFLITGGFEPYDEDDKAAFDAEAIKAALTERELYLEQMKNDSKKNNKNEKKTGFGGKASTSASKSISKDGLPF